VVEVKGGDAYADVKLNPINPDIVKIRREGK
jgi:hypothetical protein